MSQPVTGNKPPDHKPAQMPLALPVRPALDRDNFFVSRSNQKALDLIDLWPDWPTPAIAIYGPPGCGKTHLAHVFAEKTGAPLLKGGAVTTNALGTLMTGPGLIIEDVERSLQDETALFHLLNHARETRFTLMLTARSAPAFWPFTLPDLVSRLHLLTIAGIDEPDDPLLQAVLVKLFTDRQLIPDPALIHYLQPRLERQFASLVRFVDYVDRQALAEKRRLTKPFLSRILRELENRPPDDDSEA